MGVGKIFQPRAPKLAMDAGTPIQFHFSPSKRKDVTPVFNIPTPPELAFAVERVRAEIAELRRQVAAGEKARTESQLRRLLNEYRTAAQEANRKLERTQQQVTGGTAEMTDAEAAMDVCNTARERLRACNAELAARLKADEASEKLRALLAELA